MSSTRKLIAEVPTEMMVQLRAIAIRRNVTIKNLVIVALNGVYLDDRWEPEKEGAPHTLWREIQ